MMRQTLALLLDAYRELNARKLFWITLIISLVIIVAFAMIGIDGQAITFLRMRFDLHGMVDPLLVYREALLSAVVVGIWLTWGAIALAVISTAGLFPDLISSGAIDLYLSKPIGRLRLFLTKYFTGLLFVALQVSLFILGCFIVMGVRVHDWRPSLFIAIPLVITMFSYLFAFSVLIGVWTRSTVAAILITVLCWMMFSVVQRVERGLLTQQQATEFATDRLERQSQYAPNPELKDELGQDRRNISWLRFFHRVFYSTELVLPKTVETTDLLDRYLISRPEIEMARQDQAPADPDGMKTFGATQRDMQIASIKTQEQVMARTPFTIIGSSLICEAVVLALAAWIFCRRDY